MLTIVLSPSLALGMYSYNNIWHDQCSLIRRGLAKLKILTARDEFFKNSFVVSPAPAKSSHRKIFRKISSRVAVIFMFDWYDSPFASPGIVPRCPPPPSPLVKCKQKDIMYVQMMIIFWRRSKRRRILLLVTEHEDEYCMYNLRRFCLLVRVS